MVDNPHNLAERGLSLFEAVSSSRDLSASERVTLVEACRIADRLEKFNGLINGDRDSWLSLDLNETGDELTVVLTDVVRQARMHASTLKALLEGFTDSGAASAAEVVAEVPDNVANIKAKFKAPKQGSASARSKRATL